MILPCIPRLHKSIYWFSDGNKKCDGEFIDGKETGEWIYYYQNGKIVEEKEF